MVVLIRGMTRAAAAVEVTLGAAVVLRRVLIPQSQQQPAVAAAPAF
jgi:hypothetical protein